MSPASGWTMLPISSSGFRSHWHLLLVPQTYMSSLPSQGFDSLGENFPPIPCQLPSMSNLHDFYFFPCNMCHSFRELTGIVTFLSFCFLFFFFGCPWCLEFSGHRSDWSHSCDLCHSCGNAESFNPLCWAGHWTCILAVQRYHRSCGTTVGILVFISFIHSLCINPIC